MKDDRANTGRTHSSTQSVINAANALTTLRLGTVPLLLWSITQMQWWLATASLGAAIITDIYDGKLARAQGSASAFGGFFDHATDAIWVSSGAWALAQMGLINAWLCPLIVLAFIQYTLDSDVLRGRTLRTSKLGKYNGIGYFVLIGTAIGSQALAQVSPSSGVFWQALTSFLAMLNQVIVVSAWLLVTSSIVSMLDRFIHAVRVRTNSD